MAAMACIWLSEKGADDPFSEVFCWDGVSPLPHRDEAITVGECINAAGKAEDISWLSMDNLERLIEWSRCVLCCGDGAGLSVAGGVAWEPLSVLSVLETGSWYSTKDGLL